MPRHKVFEEETIAFNIRLPETLREQIAQRAQQNYRSLNLEIVYLLELALNHLTANPTPKEKESEN